MDKINFDKAKREVFGWVYGGLEDIRRILEYNVYVHESGSNFSANILILNLIDFISDFAFFPSEKEIEQAEKEYEEIKKIIKSVNQLKQSYKERIFNWIEHQLKIGIYKNRDSFVLFINYYFPQEYKEISNYLWQLFRHGHAHIFLPKSLKIKNGENVAVGVDWMYKPNTDPNYQIGMSERDISELCKGSKWKKWHHAQINNNQLRIIPQIFYGHLKKAVQDFEKDLELKNNKEKRKTFIRAYSFWKKQL